MKIFHQTLLLFVVLLVAVRGVAAPPPTLNSVWPAAPAPHPRLFFDDATMSRLGDARKDPVLEETAAYLLKEARKKCDSAPLTRVQTGKRLLMVSREALQRLMYWSWAWRVEKDDVYLERTIQEMDAVCGFSDWNPSHFLDVAEMTLAVAVGYDTFYHRLSEEQRTRYRKAIVELGLDPGLGVKNWWVTGHNNWNQVCHGGLLAGALAVMEDEPDRARRTVERAIMGLPYGMKAYAPDGAYPEGPGYWVYGTTYNVIALDLLETVFGTSFALEEASGFMASAEYFLQTTGPTGGWTNYADCGMRTSGVITTAWFARQAEDPSVFWNDYQWMERRPVGGRLAPLLFRWLPEGAFDLPPTALSWKGGGVNPVAMHRSSWRDPNAWFLFVKGGTPSAPHGHMDLGSFILEGDGQRWVTDLGAEGYNAIEQLGMNLWSQKNGSDRWTVYRYHTRGHSTLLVDDREQVASAKAEIVDHQPWPKAQTSVDLSAAYAGSLHRAGRTAQLREGGCTVTDFLQAGEKGAAVEWAFHTRAAVTVEGDRLTLKRGDATLRVQAPSGLTWSTTSLAKPPNEWDTPDASVTRCAFGRKLAAGEKATWTVVFGE